MKKLLTIQDISCYGQCSLTVALPLISACGIETVILPSAVLSTHTAGFSGYTFRDLTEDMGPIEAHWNKEGLKYDAFYTGYVCPNQIAPILSIMKSCSARGALRIVDPVMADNGKMYPGFDETFPAKMRELCIGCDYLLPNLTEAAFLLEEKPCLEGYDQAYIESTCHKLQKMGAKNVVLTGVSFEADKLGFAVLYENGTLQYGYNPRINRSSHGTGDVYAAVFAGALMRGKNAFDAAKLAADIVCESIRQTPEDHWYGVCFERAIPLLVRELDK